MRYEAPETVESAVAFLAGARGDVRVLAGGTDLLVQMRSEIVDPELIVDIKRIAETRTIGEEKGGWRIGAAVTGAELGSIPPQAGVAGVVEATNLIGSTQVRAAPWARNLCMLAGGRQCCAHRRGRRRHALGGPRGRRISHRGRHAGPRKLALTKGEFVVSFLLPPRPPRASDAYLRFIPRTEMDIAVVGAGVSLTVDDAGTITAARVSLGQWRRACCGEQAAAAIVGSRLDQRAGPAGPRPEAACAPIDDKRGTVDFRIQVAGVLARRAALIALDRARTR
jgi:carbon-monoxide dehydrogenase medium subunit